MEQTKEVDLSELSVSELKKLSAKIDKEMAGRQESGKKNLLREIEKLAASEGWTLAELLPGVELPTTSRRGRKPGSANKLAGTKVAPKYRHPENAELEWTGRGRAPKWVSEWVNNGGSMEQLVIADAE